MIYELRLDGMKNITLIKGIIDNYFEWELYRIYDIWGCKENELKQVYDFYLNKDQLIYNNILAVDFLCVGGYMPKKRIKTHNQLLQYFGIRKKMNLKI